MKGVCKQISPVPRSGIGVLAPGWDRELLSWQAAHLQPGAGLFTALGLGERAQVGSETQLCPVLRLS